jgi:hypothetical protein
MCREVVLEVLRDVPGTAMMNQILDKVAQQARINASRRQAERRLEVSSLVSRLVDRIPAVSAAMSIMEEVIGMTVWRTGVNEVWAIMEGDKRMQRLVGWRMESQRMDERLLLESIEKEARLERVKELRKAHQGTYRCKDIEMDWSTENEMKKEWKWTGWKKRPRSMPS